MPNSIFNALIAAATFKNGVPVAPAVALPSVSITKSAKLPVPVLVTTTLFKVIAPALPEPPEPAVTPGVPVAAKPSPSKTCSFAISILSASIPILIPS